jgi:tetratricopeptide (TPR) repeat protein
MDEKNRGNACFTSGDTDGALALYSAGIERVVSLGEHVTSSDRNALPVLFSNRAKMHLDAGRTQEALQDAEAAVALDSLWGKAFCRRGQARAASSQFAAAIVDFKMAVKLDPSLKDELQSAIKSARVKRGTKKVGESIHFVPNEALRQQIAAQRRLCALYVYRFHVPSKGPGSPPKLIEFAASILHSAAKIEIKRQFHLAATTGDPGAVYSLYSALFEGARYIETEGESFQISSDAIKQQITEEFGVEPSKEHARKLSARDSSRRNQCADAPVTSNPPLFVMLESQESGRKLFPGGPEWLKNPERFYHALMASSSVKKGRKNFPFDAFTTLGTNVTSQRNLDKGMYLLQDAYKLCRTEPMTIAHHIELFLRSGQRVTTREPLESLVTYDDIYNADTTGIDWHVEQDQNLLSALQWPVRVCEYCAAPLLMASPAECICGEPYCSDECHAADWSAHQSTCSLVVETLGPSLELTESYWALVLNGSLPSPIPGRVDFVQQFKDGVAEGALSEDDELQFYYDCERTHYAEVVGVLQDHYRQAHSAAILPASGDDAIEDSDDDEPAQHAPVKNQTPEEKALLQLLYEILVQRLQMSTPLTTDSLQRLLFKQSMLTVYKAMSDANPVLGSMSKSPDFKDAEKNIARRIEEVKKQQARTPARHHSGPIVATAGRMDLRQMFYNF